MEKGNPGFYSRGFLVISLFNGKRKPRLLAGAFLLSFSMD